MIHVTELHTNHISKNSRKAHMAKIKCHTVVLWMFLLFLKLFEVCFFS